MDAVVKMRGVNQGSGSNRALDGFDLEIAGVGLWVLASAETLDDDELRRAEIDPAYG